MEEIKEMFDNISSIDSIKNNADINEELNNQFNKEYIEKKDFSTIYKFIR